MRVHKQPQDVPDNRMSLRGTSHIPQAKENTEVTIFLASVSLGK